MKDYYDIYLIYKFKFKDVNVVKFRQSVEKTFKKRKFNSDLVTNLNIVKNSNILRKKWLSYSRKNNYAKNLDFDETIKCLQQFIELLVLVAV